MKTRTCILVAAIASLAVLGWWDHRKLIALRENLDRLHARAVTLGMQQEATPFTKRPRPDRTTEAKLAAAAFIKLHKTREAVKLAGGDPDKSPVTSANASSEWMALLDSKQIRVVIGEILSDAELDDKSRRKLIGNAVWLLIKDDPAGALSLFTEFSPQLKDTGLGRQIARESLAALAKENPHAALAWARDHSKAFPEIIKWGQGTLIYNTALQDPALAFEIIREFGPQRSPGDAEATILSSSKPEMRTTAIAALRQHLAAMDDETARRNVAQRAWAGLAPGIAQDGFKSGSEWLVSVNPTPEELSSVLQRMANGGKVDETARWVEWAADVLPAGEGAECIFHMMRNWTGSDFQAAGQWINACPDSPMKYTAIRAYAEMLARTEPEAASQWAMTLPPGEKRDTTLKNILLTWPKEDTAGREAFAEAHGIK
jgi:hypothetical protein